MKDEKLREYVKEEFVKSGFISVSQWKNFIDYLQILLKQERERIEKLIDKWADEDNGYPEISKGDIKLLKLKLEKLD